MQLGPTDGADKIVLTELSDDGVKHIAWVRQNDGAWLAYLNTADGGHMRLQPLDFPDWDDLAAWMVSRGAYWRKKAGGA